MSLEKIIADIEGKKYSFTVETIPSEEPAVVYRTPSGRPLTSR